MTLEQTNELVLRLRKLLDEAADLTDAGPIPDDLAPEAFLPDHLDSIGLTTLLSLIEDEIGVAFEDDEIKPEMFWSLQTLANAVIAKQRGS